MGIEYNAVQFLRYAAKRRQFGQVATIGRQSMDITEEQLRRVMSLPAEYKHERYCERLLTECFGAEGVESFDYSDFEGASHIVDLNRPLGKQYRGYDTVMDIGCLEHIYNVPQAFKNLSELCNEGGQILHILPANNLCGHGFWQFSPELFFSLYRKENGYEETQVFLADLSRQDFWFHISPPEEGKRLILDTWATLYLLCRTIKRSTFSHENVQQSDYVFVWAQDGDACAATQQASVSAPRKGRPVRRDTISRFVQSLRHMRATMKGELTSRVSRPEITKLRISSLV